MIIALGGVYEHMTQTAHLSATCNSYHHEQDEWLLSSINITSASWTSNFNAVPLVNGKILLASKS